MAVLERTGTVPRRPTGLRHGGVLVVAAGLLLTGCHSGSDGAEGTSGQDGSRNVHVAEGSDGATGMHGARGADGTAGVEAPGVDGRPGAESSDGAPVSGSGRLTSRQLTLSGVSALDVEATFVVRVTIGEPEQVTVRMDDNLTGLVQATVHGDRLRLGLAPGASVRNATLSAEVTVRDLDRLTSSGASEVRLASEVTGERFELDAGGASRITGAVDVAAVQAGASGASTLALSGRAGHLDLSGSGTSALRLADLTVGELDAVLAGVSCASVAVSDSLAARAGGASTLSYSGEPRITRRETSGVSSIVSARVSGDRCGTQR